MIIRHVQVENFLSHRDAQVTLPDEGLILISGRSGAGKSSLVVDAIGFALFGLRATRARRLDDLRRLGSDGERMRVLLALEAADGTTFQIERGVDEDGRSYVSLTDSAGGYAEGTQAVAEAIREITGRLEPAVYHHAFVARQNDIAALTTMDGSKRRDFIHQTVGLDAIEKLRQRLRQAKREHQTIVDHLLADDVDPAVTERALNEATARAEDASHEATQARAASDAARQEAQALEAELAPRRARRAEIDAARASRASREQQAARVDADLRIARERRAGAESARALAAEIPARMAAVESARASAARAALDAQIARLQAEGASDMVPDPPEAPALDEIDARVAALTAAGKARKEARDELAAQGERSIEEGICATCERPLAEHAERVRARLAERLAEADRVLAAERAEWAELRRRRPASEAAQKVIREREAAQARHAAREREISRLVAERDALPEGEAGIDLDRAQAALAEAEAARAPAGAYDAHAAEVTRLEADARRLAAEIAEIGEIPEASADDADEARLRDLLRAQAEAERAAGEAESRSQAAAGAVRTAEAAHQHALSHHEQLLARRAELQATEQLQRLIDGFRTHMMGELRPQLEQMCSELLETLSEGRQPAIQIASDYEVSLRRTNPDGWLPVKLVSGGEEVRVNFALRLALTRLVSQRTGTPLRYLILDEVFGSQDAGHRDAMIELLRSVRAFYPQVLIVSHVGELREKGLVDWVVDIAEDGALQLAAL